VGVAQAPMVAVPAQRHWVPQRVVHHLYRLRTVGYPARPFALVTSKSSRTELLQCSGSKTREETKRKGALFDMEFSQPQRRDRVRGLALGLGGIKNLNFPVRQREATPEVCAGRDRQATANENPAFAGRNSEQKRGFRLTPRPSSQSGLRHGRQKKPIECRQDWRRRP
jgi:hypothetical protein